MKLTLLGHAYESRVDHFTDLYQGIVSRYSHEVDSYKIQQYFEPVLSKSQNLRNIRLWPENYTQLPTTTNRKRDIPLPIIEMVPSPHLESGYSFYYDCGHAFNFEGSYSKWDRELFNSRIPGELIESTKSSNLQKAYNALLKDGLIQLLKNGIKSVDETVDMLKKQAENLIKFKKSDSVILQAKQAIKKNKLP